MDFERFPALGRWGRRFSAGNAWRSVLRAEGCWLGVGLAVGIVESAKMTPSPLGILSSMIAGAIVLGTTGMPLVLLGARGRDVLGGAVVGLTLAAFYAGWGPQSEAAARLSLAMVAGALTASTGWPLVRSASRVAFLPFKSTPSY